MKAGRREAAALDLLLPSLKEEGFEVFLHPDDGMLPSFMRGLRPDAIAVRHDKKLAVEVVTGEAGSRGKLNRLQDALDGQSDWELRVYLASALPEDQPVPRQEDAQVRRSVAEVERLLESGFHQPALLQGWAAFEAAVRANAPGSFERPQTSGRLVEKLASDGIVLPDDADRLREASRIRNRVAHGDLSAAVPPGLVEDVMRITRSIIDLPEAA